MVGIAVLGVTTHDTFFHQTKIIDVFLISQQKQMLWNLLGSPQQAPSSLS